MWGHVAPQKRLVTSQKIFLLIQDFGILPLCNRFFSFVAEFLPKNDEEQSGVFVFPPGGGTTMRHSASEGRGGSLPGVPLQAMSGAKHVH